MLQRVFDECFFGLNVIFCDMVLWLMQGVLDGVFIKIDVYVGGECFMYFDGQFQVCVQFVIDDVIIDFGNLVRLFGIVCVEVCDQVVCGGWLLE